MILIMKIEVKKMLLRTGLTILIFSGLIVSSSAQKMKYVFPLEEAAGLQMSVRWDTVAGATAYAIRDNTNGGAFSAWDSIGNYKSIKYTSGINRNEKYCFQIRAFKGGSWQPPGDSICNMHGPNIWPVSTSPANCNSEAVDLLNGFGDPLDITGVYLHSGCDINGINGIGNECIKAPMGSIINAMSSTYNGVNLYVDIEVRRRAESRLIRFNHVDSIDLEVLTGKSVEHGQKLAQIDDRPAFPSGGLWTILTSHTHFHYFGFGNFWGTTRPPYTFFDSMKYRDPMQVRPQVMNRNGGNDSIEFGKGPDKTEYFTKDTVFHEVDIYVEAVDRQSRDIPWVNPKEAGYYIQRFEDGNWKDKVQTSAKPYKLYDNKNFYNSHSNTRGTNANMTLLHILMDTLDAKHNTRWPSYVWDSHNNWCLTNTKDTTGSRATMDADQCFASNARKDETNPNGYRTGYEIAIVNEDAKFPDGSYRVGVMLADWEGRAPDFYRNFQVDNFKPYIKAVVMTTDGSKIYDAQWEYQRNNAKLVFKKDNNLSGKAKCDKDLIIEVEVSEIMTGLLMDVPKCGFSKYKDSSEAEAGSKYLKYKFTIPADKVANGADANPVELIFDGKDLCGNLVFGFNTESDRYADQVPRRKDHTGIWITGAGSDKEKMHKFTLDTVEISLDVTDATCKGASDGEIDLTVEKGEPPMTFEWSNGATSEDLTGLDPGIYSVVAKDKNKCKAEEEAEVKEKFPVTARISGGGSYEIRPCDPAPRIPLVAYATTGRSPFTYSWGNPTKIVSSDGEYSVTITDDRGCKDDATAYVWFIPVRCSRDPNDIIGPEGYGDEKWVSTFETLPYRIRYENDPDFATAPAQQVTIHHPLDTNVDIRTFRLAEFGFANFRFDVPENTISYSKRLDLRDSMGIYVDVIAGIDVTKREAFWIFSSIDPSTGLPPDDANAGFLPVNDTSVQDGEGYVDYTIRARSDAQTRDSIRAIAEIVFDDNEEIVTPKIFNLIDAVAPASAINGLSEISDSSEVLLSWIAADDSAASGLRHYDLFVSPNDGDFELVTEGITDSFVYFKGSPGNSYRFYTIAEDNVGNRENAKSDSFISTAIPSEGDLLKPIDSGAYCKGDTLMVEWYKTNISLIDIEYSADSGQTFSTVATFVSVIDTVYHWPLPDSLPDNQDYLVRVVSSSGAVPLDTSNAFFLAPSPVVNLGNDTSFCANETISVLLDAGNSGATYLWTTSDSTRTVTAASAGVFGVTVTNSFGCTAYDELYIDTLSVPSIEAVILDNVCFGGQTGAIDLTISSGSPPYAYLWNTADTTQDLSGLVTGKYSVTITDSNSCSALDTFSVNEPPAISLSGTVSDALCFGSSDGSINLTVSGGTGSYTYDWSNGDSTEDISGLVNGTYMVIVTDTNNCTATDTFVVSQPAALTSSITVRHVSCFDGSNGGIDLTVSGGTTPYSFVWNTSDTSEDINNLTAGTYTVTVADSNSCVMRDTAVINQPTRIVLTDTITNASCYKGSDGRIALGATGGSGSYTFAWSNSATTSKVSGLDSGRYSVIVTDDSGCVALDTFNITHPQELKISNTIKDALCFGSSDGSVDLTISGGTNPYSYVWSNSDTTQDINGLPKGSYSVVVTDNNGCMAYDTFSVNEPPQIMVSDTITNVSCYGGSDGAIDIGIVNGSGTLTFAWSSGQSSQNVSGLALGQYSVVITDGNGCVAFDTFTIAQPSDLSISRSVTDISCNGGSDGAIDVTVSGATAPYNFSWADLVNTEDRQNIGAGTFILTITDDEGCTWNDTTVMIEPSLITSNIVVIDVSCFNAGDGSVDLTASGGTGTLSFSWSSGPVTEDISGLDTGSYIVIITDDNGCQISDTAIIDQPEQMNITAIINDAGCYGNSDGSIDVSVSGGIQPYSYQWTHGPASQDISNLSRGTYLLTVTDDNLCTSNDSFDVSEPDSLMITLTVSHVLCADSSGGAIDLSVTGGTGPYNFDWNNSDTTEDLTDLTKGIYSVMITDDHGCQAMDSVEITEPAPMVVLAATTDALCHGDSNGMVDLTVSGGILPYHFMWNNSDTTEDLNEVPSDTYFVEIMDGNGCVAKDTVVVYEPDPLVLNLDSVPAHGDNSDGMAWVTVTGGTQPYSYQWNDPLSQTTDTAFDLVAGTYNVVVTDDNGCTTNASVIVTKTTGFEVVAADNEVIVYPNPNSGTVYIFNLLEFSKTVDLVISDYAGREIFNEQINGQDRYEYKFESDASEGVYIFMLRAENRYIYKRIILLR